MRPLEWKPGASSLLPSLQQTGVEHLCRAEPCQVPGCAGGEQTRGCPWPVLSRQGHTVYKPHTPRSSSCCHQAVGEALQAGLSWGSDWQGPDLRVTSH